MVDTLDRVVGGNRTARSPVRCVLGFTMMKQIDVDVLRAVSGGVGPFECSAKFFPDGSLAGPWVHSSGVWDWNRQLCEEKAIGRSVRR